MGDVVYWWEAYSYGFSQFKVLLFFASLICLFILFLIIAFFSKKRASVISFRLAAGFLVLAFAMPFASRFKEEVAFRKACNEEAGVRVYRQLELGREYWGPYDQEAGPSDSKNNYVLTDLGIEVFRDALEAGGYSLVRERLDLGDVQGFVYQLIITDSNEVISEAKNFWGGPTGLLSQRSRICSDLKKHEDMVFPSFRGDLLRPFLILD